MAILVACAAYVATRDRERDKDIDIKPMALLGLCALVGLSFLANSNEVYVATALAIVFLVIGESTLVTLLLALKGVTRPEVGKANRSEVEKRIADDVEQEEAEIANEGGGQLARQPKDTRQTSDAPAELTGAGQDTQSGKELSSTVRWSREQYLAFEKAVFDCLEKSLQSENPTIRRQVKISSPTKGKIYLDGIIALGRKRILVEVKLAGRRSSIQDAIRQVSVAVEAYEEYAKITGRKRLAMGILVVPAQERILPGYGSVRVLYFDQDANLFTNVDNIKRWLDDFVGELYEEN